VVAVEATKTLVGLTALVVLALVMGSTLLLGLARTRHRMVVVAAGLAPAPSGLAIRA
jgi:hypothetical protein